MIGSPAQSQHSHWGSSDGVAYIHTTPLLQGKPVSEPCRSPFEAAAVQQQPPEANGGHKPHHSRSHSQPQLPMIMEQTLNPSASPSDTAHFSSGTTTSSCSSPSASTAANASSTDLRGFPDGSVDGPLHLQPITPHYPMQGSTPFHGLHGSGVLQPADYKLGTGGLNKSRYRGVSYDKKKRKWRVQIKVATLGKSGVSVGYYDTEENAARAYDRAAIGLLGRDNCSITTNFPLGDYDEEIVPQLIGKTREEVKTTLKNERAKVPRRRFSSRQRTSRYMGVGSSNRKNQWQARILVHGKVTHLGYYETEEDAARVYDRVSISLHGDAAQTNFPPVEYQGQDRREYSGLDREDLQRALGVKPMDKSSKFRGVSKKKGKWEAKVMVNRKWAYRELFDSEEEAARAYDGAVWRLKPKEAKSYVNFKERPGQTSNKLAKAARIIERAQAKERVGSSQNSPSSTRSLPPLAPAHDSASEAMLGQQPYPLQQQQGFPNPFQAPLQGFPIGIKLEHSPGATFSPSLSRAAQSSAVANLGAAPPPANSPGSLSRTSSSHTLPAGINPMGASRGGRNPPAWLCQPLSTPAPFTQNRVYQLEGTPAMQSGQSVLNLQQPGMPNAQMVHSMSRTLSEADISNQSAMSAMTGSSVQHQANAPSVASRPNFRSQPPVGENGHCLPLSPQKLRSSVSHQDLSCNTFKLGSPPQTLHSPLPHPPGLQMGAPLPPQLSGQGIAPPPLQQQPQQQQQQGSNMMVRVGSETHFIPEAQASYFGMSRVPSAPFMHIEQRHSSGATPFVLDDRMHSDPNLGPQGHPPAGGWAPDSQQVLGIKQDTSDMQVDTPRLPQAGAAATPAQNQSHFGNYTPSQPPFQTPNSPQVSYGRPPQHHNHMGSSQQGHMGYQQGHMAMLPPVQSLQSHSSLPYQQLQHSPQLQQSPQLQHSPQQQQQQQQLHRQQEQQWRRIQQLQEQLHHAQQQQQQQLRQQQMQQQGQEQGQTHGQGGSGQAPGQSGYGQASGQGIPRSASVNHVNMQWQQGNHMGRSASTSNLMMPGGQSWVNSTQNHTDSRGDYTDHMAAPQLHSQSTSMHFNQHQSMGQPSFDVGPSPTGDDRGMEGMTQDDQNQMSSQDLLADLSANQLLAQADLTDCNSPLKIVQIGGDDLFETDETAGNEFLLDAEEAMSPQG